jgi:hypothetical protein
MNTSTPAQVLVVITGPPSLDSELVDWLLLQNGGTGFSSAMAYGHSTHHDHLTIAEQVSGRQKRIQFQAQISASQLESFVAALKLEFAGADLHYWVVPVLAGGHLA